MGDSDVSKLNYKLDNLIAIIDWNGLQIDGKNEDVMNVSPIDEKFAAFGWECAYDKWPRFCANI